MGFYHWKKPWVGEIEKYQIAQGHLFKAQRNWLILHDERIEHIVDAIEEWKDVIEKLAEVTTGWKDNLNELEKYHAGNYKEINEALLRLPDAQRIVALENEIDHIKYELKALMDAARKAGIAESSRAKVPATDRTDKKQVGQEFRSESTVLTKKGTKHFQFNYDPDKIIRY
jgi:predicted  nucleic acid-binding Zn-ribbon protein